MALAQGASGGVGRQARRGGLHSQPLEPAGEGMPVARTRVAHPNPI